MSKFITLILAGSFILFSLSGCAAKSQPQKDTQYYDRANKAAKESHESLDRE